MSCRSCKTSKSGVSHLLKFSELLDNQQKRNNVTETVYISAEDFIKRDKYALLLFAYCSDPAQFEKKFGKYCDFADDFNSDDLKALADLWQDGGDKDAGFSVEQVFGSMEVDLKKVANCNIKFV